MRCIYCFDPLDHPGHCCCNKCQSVHDQNMSFKPQECRECKTVLAFSEEVAGVCNPCAKNIIDAHNSMLDLNENLKDDLTLSKVCLADARLDAKSLRKQLEASRRLLRVRQDNAEDDVARLENEIVDLEETLNEEVSQNMWTNCRDSDPSIAGLYIVGASVGRAVDNRYEYFLLPWTNEDGWLTENLPSFNYWRRIQTLDEEDREEEITATKCLFC